MNTGIGLTQDPAELQPFISGKTISQEFPSAVLEDTMHSIRIKSLVDGEAW